MPSSNRPSSLGPLNATLYGKRGFTGMIVKAIEMGRLFWVILVDLKCDHKYPYKWKAE